MVGIVKFETVSNSEHSFVLREHGYEAKESDNPCAPWGTDHWINLHEDARCSEEFSTEITGQQMGHGMPDSWLECTPKMLVFKYRISLLSPRTLLLCKVCPLKFWEDRVLSRILSFRGKLFEQLSRGCVGVLLNKNLGFRCAELACDAIWEVNWSHL